MSAERNLQETAGRRTERWTWDAEVQFRSGNRRANVRLRDISPLGARIKGVFLVHEGDRFFIRFAGMEAIEATVAWVAEFEFGCEFVRPLSPVILEALVSRR